MPFRRLRRRLDTLQGEAMDLMGLAKDVLEDFQDGFTINLTIMGKVWPIGVQINLNDVADNNTTTNDELETE